MSSEFLLTTYCVLILLASLAGGVIPLMVRLTHQRLQLAVSLVAGVMLGVGLLHMLPHALGEAPAHSEAIFAWVLGGVLTMFFIERFFCFHHHDVPMPESEAGVGSSGDPVPHDHEGESHRHGHASAAGQGRFGPQAHRLGWVGAAIGLTLHTVIAGIALAASIEAERENAHVAALAGFGTFLAIFLHKPFDAMTITTLMTVGSWKKSSAHLVNGLFALMIPVGVGLFYLGLSHAGDGTNLIAYALAFSAGTFLCVSLSDLLPELQFHTHNRVALSAALLLGLSVSGGVSLLESDEHDHSGHGHSLAAVEAGSEPHHVRGVVGGPSGQGHEGVHPDGGREHAGEGLKPEQLGQKNRAPVPPAVPGRLSTDGAKRVSRSTPFSAT